MVPEWLRTRLGRRFRLIDRQRGYNLALRTPAGMEVLQDLTEFCRAGELAPTGLSEFEIGRHTGRQDVFLRIQQHLNMNYEELFHLLQGRSIVRPEDFSRGTQG